MRAKVISTYFGEQLLERVRAWKLKRDPRWSKFEQWTKSYNSPGVIISFSYWLEVLEEGENEMAKSWKARQGVRMR